jgi:hypothetical protein
VGQFVFASGYSSFLQSDFGTCADTLFNVLPTAEPLSSRTRVYLAACQYNLNMKSLAAFHVEQIGEKSLRPKEVEIYAKLKGNLKNELAAIHAASWLIIPYAGGGNKPDSSRFNGLDAEVFKAL